MNVKINGWDCQMSVREFSELAAMMKAPETAPELFDAGDTKMPELGSLRNLVTLRMPSGEYLSFARVADLIAHFPELKGGYNDIGGVRSTDTVDYVRKQARKLYDRLKPGSRFSELIRYTVNNKCITAVVRDGGRISVVVTEAA